MKSFLIKQGLLDEKTLDIRPPDVGRDYKGKIPKYGFPLFMHEFIKKNISQWTEIPLKALPEFVKSGFYTVCCPKIWPVMIQVDAATMNNEPVLICGPTGTGKSLIADMIKTRIIKTIKDDKDEKDKAKTEKIQSEYEIRNCAAFPENAIDDELFGHGEKVYTNVPKMKEGLFEISHVVFLDEIDKLSLSGQGKLLRVIESGKSKRFGEHSERDILCKKIIFATNKDLKTLVNNGEFLSDLYYRIHINKVELPSLQERGRDDFDLLFVFFVLEALKEDIEKSVQNFKSLSDHEKGYIVKGNKTVAKKEWDFPLLEARKQFNPNDLLFNYLKADNFSGNVRQLKAEITRVIGYSRAMEKHSLCNNVFIGFLLMAHQLWFRKETATTAKGKTSPDDLNAARDQFEKYHIQRIRSTSGSNKEAWEKLGISESQFYTLKKKHEI